MFNRISARATCLAAGAAIALALAAAPSFAQDYPNKQIRLVIAYPAGAGVDLDARLVAPKLAEALGQPVVVENRGGPGSIAGTEHVAKAEPDGYTLLMGTGSTQAANVSLYKNLPYDPIKDFTPIARVASHPEFMAVPADSKATSAKEFIALAKAAPQDYNYGSTGVGTLIHLAGARFAALNGLNIRHVPYRTSAQALTSLVNSEIKMMIGPFSALKPFVEDKKIRLLAMTGEKRSEYSPDVPTMDEIGIPNMVISSWSGLWGPKGLPQPIVDKVYNALAKALADPGLKQQFIATGTDAYLANAAELLAFNQKEIDVQRRDIELAGIKPQ